MAKLHRSISVIADLKELEDRVNSLNTPQRRRFSARSHRGKTVSKLFALELLGLALSEKQIPQIVETIRSVEN